MNMKEILLSNISDKTHRVYEKTGNKISKLIVYSSYDDQTQTYSNKKYEAVYNWNNNILQSIDYTEYNSDGSVYTTTNIQLDEDSSKVEVRNIMNDMKASLRDLIGGI